MKIIMVGFGTAAFAAYLTIKKYCMDAEITIVDKKEYDLMHPCGIPFSLDGTMKVENLKHNFAEMKAKKFFGYECLKVFPRNHEILVQKCGTDKRMRIPYDSLILSTGLKPMIVPIRGIGNFLNKSVFTVACPEDAEKLINLQNKIKNVIVVGAGAIGLESAVALKNEGCNVTVVEMRSTLFSGILDADIASLVKAHLEFVGVNFLFNSKLNGLVGKNGILNGALINDQKVSCDIMLLCCGMNADLSYLEESGLESGKLGVKVNSKMQTNFKNIYAVGDIVGINSLLSNSKTRSTLATQAYQQGQVAAKNIYGKKAHYNGTAFAFVSVVGNKEVAACGLAKDRSEKEGFDVIVGKAKTVDVPEWAFSDDRKNHEVIVKILMDKTTHELIGCQAFGKGASSYVNICSTAINAKMKVDDLVNVEFAYCPKVSNLPNALTLACENAIRKIDFK